MAHKYSAYWGLVLFKTNSTFCEPGICTKTLPQVICAGKNNPGLPMKLPGFTHGQKAQNTVVGAMYIVVLIAIVGVVAVSVGVPGMLSSDGGSGSSQAAAPAGTAQQEQTQMQGQSQSEGESQGSGWVTVTSAGDSGGSSAGVGTSTQRVNPQQIQLNLVRDAMANSSRVQLVSADIRNNELYVRYSQQNMSRPEILSGMGTVVGAYGGLVTTGASLDSVHGTVVDGSGQTAYTYTVQQSVVKQYNNGGMSDSEYRQQVVSQLQQANQSSSTAVVS